MATVQSISERYKTGRVMSLKFAPSGSWDAPQASRPLPPRYVSRKAR